MPLSHRWDLTPREARVLQQELRGQVVLAPPAGFAPRYVAGADLSFDRFATHGWAGIVVLDVADGLRTVDEVVVRASLDFPYVPGLLSFRELPPVAAAWERLRVRPDVVVFDGQGIAHPRRFGVACHAGLVFGVPTVGCAKSILVGAHAPLADEAGSSAPLVHDGDVVGVALRLRARVQPVYVSPGHLIDLDTAVAVVRSVASGYREPETTRRAHGIVNSYRRRGSEY